LNPLGGELGVDGYRIPSELGKLTLLRELKLDNDLFNNFRGKGLCCELPSELGNLSLLSSLTLNDQFISGSTPNEVCALVPRPLAVADFQAACRSGTDIDFACPADCCTCQT
jgi:hypothetical protein